MHNRQSNKQVFSSLEFVNILLQIEAKTVKNVSHFFNSAVIANSKMDYYLCLAKERSGMNNLNSVQMIHVA